MKKKSIQVYTDMKSKEKLISIVKARKKVEGAHITQAQVLSEIIEQAFFEFNYTKFVTSYIED